MVLIFLGAFTNCSAQINLQDKIVKKAKQRIEKKTDQGIDKGLDNIEDGLEKAVKGESEEDTEAETKSNKTEKEENETLTETDTKKAELNWAKYDFVPGDKVIFEDNQVGEENGEFPSRWDLFQGTVEIANFGGDNVIMFRGGSPTIIPYLKNPEKDYLPDVFTVELDLYKPSGSFNIYLYDRKNQKVSSNATFFNLWSNSMECHSAKSDLPGNKNIDSKWVHIAIAYTNGKLKGYIDDTRLINIPHLEFNPSGLSLHCYHASDQNRVYVKNVRIAEGGVKYYDRYLQDGKIVTNGIRFDINKATIRPESMGIINSIYKLIDENSELKFSVEGHTDSDGDFDYNQKLSEERAEAVMNKLVEMGIDKKRLSSRGFGESKPVDNNETPEGKANNRRVEFVKM